MAARCVVVGAGIVGSSISLRLAQQGADVTVVEEFRPGYGATANSFAWVGESHPGLHEPEPYFRLNELGVQAYRRLEAEFDVAPWFVRSGCLTWSTSVRIGLRVLPGDELPVVGRIPGHDNVYVCATHSGVTLAPLLAELVTGEILRDADSPLLSTFRPDRFTAEEVTGCASDA